MCFWVSIWFSSLHLFLNDFNSVLANHENSELLFRTDFRNLNLSRLVHGVSLQTGVYSALGSWHKMTQSKQKGTFVYIIRKRYLLYPSHPNQILSFSTTETNQPGLRAAIFMTGWSVWMREQWYGKILGLCDRYHRVTYRSILKSLSSFCFIWWSMSTF